MKDLFMKASAAIYHQVKAVESKPDSNAAGHAFFARHADEAGNEDAVIVFATGAAAAELMRVLRANSLSFDSPDTPAGRN